MSRSNTITYHLALSTDHLRIERNKSIRCLSQLKEPDWNLYRDHKYFGKMSARMVLHNWLAHDYIHIRQINRYRYQMLERNSEDSLEYAGNW